MPMKFRAHDTFFIRKGWLSKGMRCVSNKPDVFVDKNENPMDVLGIGANMVKALRYWLQVVGLTEEPSKGKRDQHFTALGRMIYEHDTYIEEFGTLYLLQYELASQKEEATAWYFFFNEFSMSEFSKEDFVAALEKFIKMEESDSSVASRSLKLITICEEMWDGLTEAELKDVLAQYTKDICGEEEGNKLSDNGLFYMAAQRRTGTKRKVRSVYYMLPDVGRWKQLPVTEDKDSGAICLQSGEFFPDLPSINTIPTDIFDILDICCRMEDMAYEEIPYESDELFDVLCKAHSGQAVPDLADAALTIMGDWEWLHHESLDFIEPRDLRSICRTRCLTHGTQLWGNNQREMLYSNAMFAPDLICSREDVYKYLRARGVSEKTAADFMTDVRKGKIFSRGYTNEQYKMLDDCDAEYWFIEACEKIQYLFPEAHEVCFSVSMLRLLWLALNGSAATKGTIIKYAAERER